LVVHSNLKSALSSAHSFFDWPTKKPPPKTAAKNFSKKYSQGIGGMLPSIVL
jgi:hypothetical protein